MVADWSGLGPQLAAAVPGGTVRAKAATTWTRAWAISTGGLCLELTVYVGREEVSRNQLANLGEVVEPLGAVEVRADGWRPRLALRFLNVWALVEAPGDDVPPAREGLRQVAAAVARFFEAHAEPELAAHLPWLEASSPEGPVQRGSSCVVRWRTKEGCRVDLRVPEGLDERARREGELELRATRVGLHPVVLQAWDPLSQLTSDFLSLELDVRAEPELPRQRVQAQLLGPGTLEPGRVVLGDDGGGDVSLVFLLEGAPGEVVLVEMRGPRHSNAPARIASRLRAVVHVSERGWEPLVGPDVSLGHGHSAAMLSGSLVVGGVDWLVEPGPPREDGLTRLRALGLEVGEPPAR